jgi:Alpha/beta hydrolase domain containing 18
MGDRIFHSLRSGFGRLAFFRGGWGPTPDRRLRSHGEWLDAVQRRATPPPAPLELSLRPHPVVSCTGEFTSPCRSFLPPESSTGRVWIVEPHASSQGRPPPVVVQLAATGDHGFWRRYFLFARHLAKAGIQSALLENPLYGRRTPATQQGAKLRTVADLVDMGRATIEECASLLSYFSSRGHSRLAAFGVSQGGLHAAMAASLCHFRVHSISALAPASAAPVFTRGVLGDAVDWDALLRSKGFGDESLARAALASHLDSVASIALFPESKHGGAHVLLAATRDEYVQRDAVDAWRAARPGVSAPAAPPGGPGSALIPHAHSPSSSRAARRWMFAT